MPHPHQQTDEASMRVIDLIGAIVASGLLWALGYVAVRALV